MGTTNWREIQAAIVKALIERLGYSPSGAESLTSDAINWRVDLREALLCWLREQSVPEIQVEGFTAARLAAEYGFNLPNALSQLNWLHESPVEAKASLRPMTIDHAVMPGRQSRPPGQGEGRR